MSLLSKHHMEWCSVSKKPISDNAIFFNLENRTLNNLAFLFSDQNESHLQFRLKHSKLQWGKVAGGWRLLTHPRIATEMESVWRSDAWQEEGRGGRDGHNVPRFKGAGGKLILIRSDVQGLVCFWELHLFTSPWTERALCALWCFKQCVFVRGRQGTSVNLVPARYSLRVCACHKETGKRPTMEVETKT